MYNICKIIQKCGEGVPEILLGFLKMIVYFAGGATLALMLRQVFHPTDEVHRKALHMLCACVIFVLLYAMPSWQTATLAAALFIVVVYPALHIAERFPIVAKLFSERKMGELRSSLVLVFLMMIILIALFWGGLGLEYRYIILAAVMAWGTGDAAAALVGKKYGKRHIRLKIADQKKTVEGTLAMAVLAFLSVLLVLLICANIPWYICLITAAVVAPVSAFIELVSRNGVDTFTVPLAAAGLIYILVTLMGGMA